MAGKVTYKSNEQRGNQIVIISLRVNLKRSVFTLNDKHANTKY